MMQTTPTPCTLAQERFALHVPLVTVPDPQQA